MALDRQSIEKRDFPIGRRGYEPEAVDEHLAAIAAEVDELRRSTGSRRATPASIAHAAADQVRSIVEAAETSAADIERAADNEAQRIRAEAEADAQETRADAVAASQEQVGKVREATQMMLQRVEAMESELGALVESLRTGANRLNADLSLLEGNLGDLQSAATPRPPRRAVAAAPPPAPVVLEPEPEPLPALPEPEPEPVAVVAEPEPEPVAVAPEPAVADDEDVEGARLVALNMALNGQPREETDRYLAENFDLSDRGGLLDEVYATVGG